MGHTDRAALKPSMAPRAVAKRTLRDAWIASQGGRCLTCGSSHHLQMHHRDKSQKEDHHIWGWAESRRAIELAKCDLLCRACHMGLHADEKKRHGTQRYRQGCRCADCCAAHKAAVGIRDRRRHNRIKALGLCSVCRKERDRPGVLICARCKDRCSAARRERLAQQRLSASEV